MSQKKSRLARKAARIVGTRAHNDHVAKLEDLRRRRDAALGSINEQFRKGVDQLEEQRRTARDLVWAEYDAEREKQIVAGAAEEQAA